MSIQRKPLFDLRNSLEFLKGIHGQSPLSIWASLGREHNYRVVYWNQGAEEIYGVSSEDAIGKNYLDLFVAEEDPQVRRDSENDCDDIINYGKTFVNYMAVDNKRIDGKKSPDHPILLLTNVFRVIVEGQGYQVEMAVEVTSSNLLPFRKPEFRTLAQVVGQIEKEVQLTTYENINTINDTRKLEALILDTILELSEAEAAIFAVPSGASPGPLTLKRFQGFSQQEVHKIQIGLRSLPNWSKWDQQNTESPHKLAKLEKEKLSHQNSQYVAPIYFSDTVFGTVVVFHHEYDFFDTRKKEAIKSFLSRVSGLYEVSTKFDFNRNWRMSLAHELLSQADKVNKALQEYFIDHPGSEVNQDLQRAKYAIQQQLDLTQNIIDSGKDYPPPSKEILDKSFMNIDLQVKSAIESQEPNIRDKNQHVKISYPSLTEEEINRLELVGSPEVVERIMRVIFNNATKYGSLDSEIEVILRKDSKSQWFILKVINEGVVTPEILKNAFHASPLLLQGSNKDGAHVGLHVSRTMARSYGGDVTLQNSADGSKVIATLKWRLRKNRKSKKPKKRVEQDARR